MNDGGVIRTILVDDHALLLDAMIAALSLHDEIEVAGSATTFEEAEQLLALSTADVVVTDLQLGGEHAGTDLVAAASRLNPPIPVLLFTGTDDKRGVEQALASGCAGFVSKYQGFDRLTDAIIAVARGAAVFPAALLTAMFERDDDDAGLSARELEVLQLLADAKTTTDISETLHLSEHTVRNHLKQVFTKLDAHSQLEAVVFAARRGLIEIR